MVDAWADIQKTNNGVPGGNFAQLKLLKNINPNLKNIISIGGWTLSGDFSPMVSTAANRKTFIDSMIEWVKEYEFDGVDFDWEYPVAGGLDGNKHDPADRVNLTLFLKEVRAALDAETAISGKKYYSSIAASANLSKYDESYDFGEIHQYLDWINLMSYDFHGVWGGELYTNHNSPLYANPGDKSVSPDNVNFNV